jgi:hypothetical protein
VAADWAPCTSPAAFPNLRDGDYQFLARLRGASHYTADQMAFSNFTLDTRPPTVQVHLPMWTTCVSKQALDLRHVHVFADLGRAAGHHGIFFAGAASVC